MLLTSTFIVDKKLTIFFLLLHYNLEKFVHQTAVIFIFEWNTKKTENFKFLSNFFFLEVVYGKWSCVLKETISTFREVSNNNIDEFCPSEGTDVVIEKNS